LTIQPGAKDDPFRAELRAYSVESYSSYSALSYGWGTAPASETISINNQPFLVRSNLFDFLKQIREADPDVALWIDAICINQNDVVERSEQVQNMDLIYVYAARVIT
jgi:hypothetical protein